MYTLFNIKLKLNFISGYSLDFVGHKTLTQALKCCISLNPTWGRLYANSPLNKQ